MNGVMFLKFYFLNNKTLRFQNYVVHQWNPSAKTVSKVIVPRVFLHDEVTTDGYGKCIIELLTKFGIITKE